MKDGERLTWLAESLRATVFAGEPLDLDHISWWTAMLGEDPAKSTLERRKGVLEERGPYEKAELVLRVESSRVDWIMTPAREEETFPPVLGPFTEAVQGFEGFVNRWLASEDLPEVDRVAFAAALLGLVSSVEEGYRKLSEFLPDVKISPGECRNLQYQINRPRKSRRGIEDLEINRLNNWSVQRLVNQRLTISEERTQVVPVETFTACSLHIDINTAADYEGRLPRVKLPDLLSELVSLGAEIAEKGDIP